MKTSKQLLRESPGNFIIRGGLVSRADRSTSLPMLDNATGKHSYVPVLIFGGIALVAYPLGRALVGLPRQEFEGLGAVLCALAYVGIFLSRVARALKQDTLQAETPKGTDTLPAARISEPDASEAENSATHSEPRT